MPPEPNLLRRGFRLEYATLGWNVITVCVIGIAALRARSVALSGFGLDSLIEIFASVVVIWHLSDSRRDREKLALQLIGGSFLSLAVYIIVQAAYIFAVGGRPVPSSLGATWLALTALVMLLLGWGRRRPVAGWETPSWLPRGRVTLIDACLAGAVLLGIALNAFLGWWWADPLSGAVIVYYALKEGVAHRRQGRTTVR